MKTEREFFEAWAKKETNWDLYWSENIKQYMDHQTNGAWFAWVASAQREGYKLVPVEPTLKMSVAYEKNSIAPVSSLSVAGYKAMIEVL